MPGNDLVGPLKAAIQRADPSWITQPSHLRRRLDEELGPDARVYRAQVHQLIVAAEERIPIRLQRDGGSPAEQAELVRLLVGARGWTMTASEWAVATWAAALGFSDERPAIAQRLTPSRKTGLDSGGADRTDRGLSDASTGPTVFPSEMEVVGSTDMSSEVPSHHVPAQWTDPIRSATAASDEVASSPEVPPVSEVVTGGAKLPRFGTGSATKKASKVLGRDLDVAYVVAVGRSPAWLLLLFVIGVPIFVVTGLVPMNFILIVGIGWIVWPSRVLAVSGDDVWLLGTTRLLSKPTNVIAESRRDRLEFSGGWPMSSVRLEGQRLWLPLPVFRAARRLPVGKVGDHS
jgi:hypothetical protein